MHIIFRAFLSQYSRQLLSILAQPQIIIKPTINCGIYCNLRFDYEMHDLLHEPNKKSEAKKNAEHTRMHTIFRSLSSQYSRRLLSILAQLQQKTQRKQI